MQIYAIGDIHGHLGKLQHAHELIARDRAAGGDPAAPVVHIGDLVDRGPDSRGVVEFLRQGVSTGAPWVVLKGNHDRMFALFLQDPPRRDPRLRPGLEWLDDRLGGRTTLASYGVDAAHGRDPTEIHAEARRKVSEAHRAFLAGLPAWYRASECFFCHAGIRPDVPLEAQSEDDLLWIRHEFLDDRRDHGALIVHGHTPVPEVEHHGNRVDIDTGAGHGRKLSAVVIEGRRVWRLTETGRSEVVPL